MLVIRGFPVSPELPAHFGNDRQLVTEPQGVLTRTQ